jgi:RNA polymerase subunit RPABC4/transcription elongation factor Spt4
MTVLAPTCDQHHTAKEWRVTTFEYIENGISIRIPNVYAWVCPADGEASFTPETVDQLIATARELVETARHARVRRPVLTEYMVSVG